jgi:hypothetical protein
MSKASQSKSRRAKVFFTVLGTVVGVVATLCTVFGTNIIRTTDWFRRLFLDEVTVACPLTEISSHKHILFGTYSPHTSRLVRVYIHPRDGQFDYWSQFPATEPGGAWSFEATFGNAYWHDMIGRSPLRYDVFVALFKDAKSVPGSESAPLVISEGVDFKTWLESNGATAVATCAVTRRDEEGCNFTPKIISPVPPENPRAFSKVSRDVVLSWEPNRELWVEIWRRGREVPEYPRNFYANPMRVSLEPGIYELRVKETKVSQCQASVWIEVAGSL